MPSLGSSRLASKVLRKKNPFSSAVVDNVSLTVGTKSGSTITVTGQVKNANGGNLAVRSAIKAYLSRNNDGSTIQSNLFRPNGGYAIGTNGLIRHGGPANETLYAIGTLAIDATVQDFKTTTTATYRAGGVQLTKNAQTGIAFTAAHVVSANKFGVILIQINAAGTISTKVPLATQAYTSAALAQAALPEPDAGNVALGYIAIAAGGGGFTANTTSLAGISTFNDAPATGQYTPDFTVIPNASGQFDIVFTESRTGFTTYLCLVMPDGTVQVSPAITF